MALISSFVHKQMDRMRLHDAIEAAYYTRDYDGKKLLQINSSGRRTRENPDKASQSIQLDEQSGAQLFEILRSHFGFK